MIKIKNHIRVFTTSLLLCLIVIVVGLLTDKFHIRLTQDRIGEAESCREIHDIPFWASQAGCYIENGLYLICYPSSYCDLLIIRCYDKNKNEFIWQKTVEGCGHANAIAYRPIDRKIYIADCFDRDRDLVNTISVLDYDDIDKGVTNIIESPARGGVYSIAYDRGTDTFYSTNYMGTVEGEANVLFSYNGVFESVKQELPLNDFSVRNDPNYSSQGVQCVIKGIAYIPYYEPQEIIVGFDLQTGERTAVRYLPEIIDDYELIEMESITYDYDSNTFVIIDGFGIIESTYLDDDYRFVTDIPFRWAMCGCYIEEEIYIIAYTSSDGNNLILRCIDFRNNCVLWTYESSDIRYANPICFRRKDRNLYIADCYTYVEKENVSNRICVLDYDNIGRGVIGEIHSPARGGIYSIGYDERGDCFYSTNFLGSNEGEANVIFSYNGIFDSVKDEFTIDDFIVRNTPLYQTMGVQCIVDNTAYILYSEPGFVVAGYDLNSEGLKFAYYVPNLTENGKAVIRPESLFYNSDTKEVMIQTATAVVYCEK